MAMGNLDIFLEMVVFQWGRCIFIDGAYKDGRAEI